MAGAVSPKLRTRAVVGLWAVGVVGLIVASRIPDPYVVHYMRIPPPYPFPWLEVVVLTLFISAEAFCFWGGIHPSVPGPVWLRSAAMTAIFGFSSFVALLGILHSTNGYWWHTIWLLALTVLTAMIALTACILAAKKRFFPAREKNA